MLNKLMLQHSTFLALVTNHNCVGIDEQIPNAQKGENYSYVPSHIRQIFTKQFTVK